MKSKTLSLKTVIKELDFLKKNSYYSIKRLKKKKVLLLLANKFIENISDPRNAKEHYQSFIIQKKRKSVKQSEIITYQPKTFAIIDIKSVIKEHQKLHINYPRLWERVKK